MGIPVVKQKFASAAATMKIENKQPIDLVSPKREGQDDVTGNKRCRTTRAAATAAANKIRNGLNNLASPKRVVCSKEAWEKEAIFEYSVGNQMRLIAKYMGKFLIDKHRGKDENRVIYDVTWTTDTESNQYVLMTRLVSAGNKGKGVSYDIESARDLIYEQILLFFFQMYFLK